MSMTRGLLLALLASALSPGLAVVQAGEIPDAPPRVLRSSWEVEYHYPVRRERQIHTVFINALLGGELAKSIHLSGYAGLTATAASGYILRWNDRFQEVRYDTSLAGLGVMVLLRCQPVQVGRVRLGIDAAGGLIAYTARFPPGGDWYNFAWKIGPVLSVALHEDLALFTGLRWMHLSNGQGLGPQNPAYEAVGATAGLQLNW